ncbi:MAG TPA: glycoside hydrolase family 15 protein [Thermomicrobiaceae bacterium]|nr:glycoside hydrolase family 15 protein [Thermomicrobiaceae bacterium]
MNAPGQPGIPPTWTSSAKDAVSTALAASRVWLTLGHGILNEVYWPRVDSPQIRDLGFIVADDQGFWTEVKRLDQYELTTPAPGVPAYTVTHRHHRFTFTLDVIPDPDRDVVLLHARLDGDEGLRLYPLLAPHLGNTGGGNTAWVDAHDGWLGLFAQRDDACLALCAADLAHRGALVRGSAGFVGASDGWQDFNQHGRMTWGYDRAESGNVALMGEAVAREVVFGLGFGDTPDMAVTLAVSSLQSPFAGPWRKQVAAWTAWQASCRLPQELPADLLREARISATVLKVHEDRTAPGAMVASLSVPWGQSRDDTGGYHLVWARDLVESAGGLLAFGATSDARRVLDYLIATQHLSGNWTQNQWLDGRPFWSGVQLDETGFPILLATRLRDAGELHGIEIGEMVRRAATYLATNGPVTGQDRWEEDAGLSPFTLAVEVAALVCAAEVLDEPARSYALELADTWNSRIEDWTYVADTDLAREHGVEGYYVRIAPPEVAAGTSVMNGFVPIKNRPLADARVSADHIVSLEFLELVRLGLRRADDPKMRDSVRLADALLAVDTPSGRVWHRYNDDGYGEQADGSPFNGVGIGRAWPLLAGERGHYALDAGQDVRPYLETMTRTSSMGGMIPEQVWDTADLPEEHLLDGRPSGSAMPLVWAHAEFLKLCASVELGHAIDRPGPVWNRYHGERPSVPWTTWRFNQRARALSAGRILRVELTAPARVHWSTDGWQTVADTDTRDTGLGIHLVDLPTGEVPVGGEVVFTIYWTAEDRWLGENVMVPVEAAGAESRVEPAPAAEHAPADE